MFLLWRIHFHKSGGKSQPQRSYKNGSYKEKRVYTNASLTGLLNFSTIKP